MQPTCPRCGPVVAIKGGECWYCGQPVNDRHVYLSTSCMHGFHDYCASTDGSNDIGDHWPKRPAVCKFCDAPCVCHCHTHGETVGPQQ